MTTPFAELAAIWRRALTEEFGLEVKLTEGSLEGYRNELYDARVKMANPALEIFKIATLSDCLFITKREVKMEE